jgi:hypothetical protein
MTNSTLDEMKDIQEEYDHSRELDISQIDKAENSEEPTSMLGKRPTRSQKWNIRLGKGKRARVFYSEEDFFLYFSDNPDFQWLHELHYPSPYALIKYYYRLESIEQENYPLMQEAF